jgi:endonuclease/exonuclease/phosphatase family metal-dependent hydrolase
MLILGMMLGAGSMLGAAAAVVSGANATAPPVATPPACRSALAPTTPDLDSPSRSIGREGSAPSAPRVHWIGPSDLSERRELDRWCGAVGPPVQHHPSSPADGGVSSTLDALVVVTWNVHVGNGDLDGFLRDLRGGLLTGAPVSRFVLLLQEAYRAGDQVPERPAGPVRGAEWIGAPDVDRRLGSIDEVARRHDLHLFYAPSMRNGSNDASSGSRAPEDRGNAILSTEPLTDLRVLELPVQRQRRAAVAATIHWSGADGGARSLDVVSAHLDHMSGWRHLHMSLGAGRADHVRRLVEVFQDEARIVVGGDFNTWAGGADEKGIRLMRNHFPLPVDPPSTGTLPHGVPFMGSLLVDYLFFRVPAGWGATYDVVPDTYGSDHRPLLGRVKTAD